MIELTIILLMLIKLNMFNGWLLALWIICVVVKSIALICETIKVIAENL